MMRKPDAQATLDRWPGWTLTIIYNSAGLLQRGAWRGPCGGRYEYYALTKRGIERRVERKLASWTRKRRHIKHRTTRKYPQKGLS